MNKHNDFYDGLTYTFEEVDKIKKELANLPIQQLNLKPDERGFEYYKGFYDATYNFMSTFTKLLDSGALNGTKFNANN